MYIGYPIYKGASVSRKRGERSEKAEIEDIKILKKRNKMLERENQRLRKELRKLETFRSEEEFEESHWTAVPIKKTNYKCDCGSDEVTTLEVSIMGKPKKYLICQLPDCRKRKRLE